MLIFMAGVFVGSLITAFLLFEYQSILHGEEE
jgi:hypothetical protein